MTVTIAVFYGCNNADENGGTGGETSEPPPASIAYSIVNQYPHDPRSFTEGLSFYKGELFESTGSPDDSIENGSWVGKVDLQTGKILKKVQLDKEFFGEGNTILNDKLYYLTWTTNKGFVYDVKTFKKLKEFTYTGEGWGLTNDGINLIMSNGTNNLAYYHPDSLTMIKMISVTDNNGPVANLNELEFINGHIFANQWQTSYILKIDPVTGKVVGKVDCNNIDNIIRQQAPEANYMNGIAYDSITKKILVTGKYWPKLFEIRFQ